MASADAFATATAEGSKALLAVPQSLKVWLAAARIRAGQPDVLDTVKRCDDRDMLSTDADIVQNMPKCYQNMMVTFLYRMLRMRAVGETAG